MSGPALRIVLLCGAPPGRVAALVSRLLREVPQVSPCAVLLVRPRRERGMRPAAAALVRLIDRDYRAYRIARAAASLRRGLGLAGQAALRLLHGWPPLGSPFAETGQARLAELCRRSGVPLVVGEAADGEEAVRLVGELAPDLAVIYERPVPATGLLALPARGAITLHRHRLPDYGGEGPPGLWELLDGRDELGVVVHRLGAAGGAGPILGEATIPIGPFDTLPSLDVKSALVGHDLIIAAVRDLASGTAEERPQLGSGRTCVAPQPHELWRLEREIAARRPRPRPRRGRGAGKLLLRTLLLAPYVAVRNLQRRLRRRYPVIVLYHHLVADRPHHLGVGTEHFLRILRFLQRHYRMARLGEAVAMLQSGQVAAPTVVLTFDDGYAENFLTLRAVAEETGVPVTLFVCTGHLGSGEEFEHDRRRRQNGFPPFTWEQVAFLRAQGYEVGSHSRSHYDCGSSDSEALAAEIVGSRADLEERLGGPVEFFSFPWGMRQNISPEALAMAKEHYPYVCSAFGGVNLPDASGDHRHLRRCSHRNDLWELELLLQSVLEFDPTADVAPPPPASRR